MTRILLAVCLLSGCASVPIARLPGGSEFVLSGPLEDAFKAITFHGTRAVTLSEKLTIYKTGEPSDAQVRCHEAFHRADAKTIADALVTAGAIEDNDRERAAAWLAVYAVGYLRHGYDNTLEHRAQAACRDVR